MYRYFTCMYVCGHVCFQSLRKPEEGPRCPWTGLWAVMWVLELNPRSSEEQSGLLRAEPSLQAVIFFLGDRQEVWNVTCQSTEGSVDAPVTKSSCYSPREPDLGTQHSCLAAHSCLWLCLHGIRQIWPPWAPTFTSTCPGHGHTCN